ncbi:MAG: helix-turn-helix domain-containing protein [Planctomycetota bacterium]
MLLKAYSLKVIEEHFKREKAVKVKTRLHLILLLREEHTQREVASMLKVSKGLVPFWKKRFETEGFSGLGDKAGRGLKPSLTEEQLSMLASSIDMGILMDDGYTRGFKTKDVVQFIQEELGKAFTPRYCRNIMKNMSCGLKVPRPRHKKRNQENVDDFKREFKKKDSVWVMIKL